MKEVIRQRNPEQGFLNTENVREIPRKHHLSGTRDLSMFPYHEIFLIFPQYSLIYARQPSYYIIRISGFWMGRKVHDGPGVVTFG